MGPAKNQVTFIIEPTFIVCHICVYVFWYILIIKMEVQDLKLFLFILVLKMINIVQDSNMGSYSFKIPPTWININRIPIWVHNVGIV